MILRFKFAVVMPAYNTGDYISKALDSLISQSMDFKKNIQVIIATHSPQIISHNWDLQIDLGGLHNG